ncbi:phosphoprotein associated with glycosphingolipid-enriched microdomains 1-like isoform X1 [Scyliorhinus canicula]|uniref:phosphoprotein associated with glycosphingolipid-enriched microdomains 1-like isoform X1 n=2 Tax=Scyliorhinus canicula TaxID=7830 RepID=UPI0018F72788|nr:phosphoprotein associated with glycosphingolipid-enriched microdomains 1-like isoform X1 [Scyliorhinus canicula]XP_038659252.1 phosphoprotein associated with glycosphingolipid-enriched microdomains 1-like isoform X1 [Scyliorhinus canicula]XP_038659253.1 phosphoprotein associated with glycosphingolipid-enriched microdomains 1-like isoform X1 [Scyliorhinus canicula]XP_038659254.1 phosphoprotein associated with glycosphingolipid-enriched microdomains 1-like isoform X1 [Scyliorhinus canicula]
MAPPPLHRFRNAMGFTQDSQPQILLCGFLVAGGAFLLLVFLAFLCNNCQSRNNKEKKIKIDGVKLVGMSVGHTPQLRPVNTLDVEVHNPNRMSCYGENGLRNWRASTDYLHLPETEPSEDGEDVPGNSSIWQNRILPKVPGNNYTGGKLPTLRKAHDMDSVYSQVKDYPSQKNSIEDSLYESVGTKYEVDHINLQRDGQSKFECGANELEVLLMSQRQLAHGVKEPAGSMNIPEYASIRKVKKKEKITNQEAAQEKQPRRNVKNGCVLLPGFRNHEEQLKLKEKSAAFSQTENHSSGIQGSLTSITECEATKSLEECGEERIAYANLTEEQPNADNACFKAEGYSFSKSREKFRSLTDEEIAAMYSKVAKKGHRKEMPLALTTGLQKDGNLNYHSWSTGNLNDEESEYESIKSPRWHSGSQLAGDDPEYASVNERTWGMKCRNGDEEEDEEEEPEPGYEAINTRWKKINFAIKSGKVQKIAHERQTENYYESISELQQSRTQVLTSGDGKEVYITGL